MTLSPNGVGGFILRQILVPPVVYLDHWAVRLFSTEQALQDRFIEALHRSKGTWLFSNVNLFEFVAMTNLEQAASAEALLLRAMPALHVADTALDPGYLFQDGVAPHPDAPEENWILKDLGKRAHIAGGTWNTHTDLCKTLSTIAKSCSLFLPH